MIKCRASGIDNIDSEVFGFVVTPVLDGVRGESVAHVSLDYQSGQVETLVISGLVEGESYTLVAMATNLFGNSQEVTSNAVIAGTLFDYLVTTLPHILNIIILAIIFFISINTTFLCNQACMVSLVVYMHMHVIKPEITQH